MYKKIIGILVCMLMIVTSVLPIVGSDTKNTAITTTPEKDCGCSTGNTNHIRMFTLPVMKSTIHSPEKEYSPPNIPLIDTPDYFSWMDYEGQDWTTPARNQGTCGSCWIMAAVAALESVINIREGIADLDPDLSEQYVLSCLPKSGEVENAGCFGGIAKSVFEYILRNDSAGDYHNGILLESCMPYKNSDPSGADMWRHTHHEPAFCEKCENWEDYLIPITEYGNVPDDRDSYKSTIMQIGPVAAGIVATLEFDIWEYSHHSPDDYYPYKYENPKYGNHVISVVGWKDDPLIGKGGYWICKDSFGPNIGYNGFFNLEYDSLAINGGWVWVNYDPASYDWHPLPKANGPYYSLINTAVQFKGNASGEHPPFTWHWDFGDQTTSEEQTPTHNYVSTGKYIVTLTVTDSNDNVFSDTTFAWIQATNLPPAKPIITGPSNIKKKEFCFYNITVSDPDGSDVYLYFEGYTMPGIWSELLPNDSVLENGAFWPEVGNFTVRAKAKDPYGAESDWATLEVNIAKSKSIIFNSPLITWVFERFPFFEKILKQ